MTTQEAAEAYSRATTNDSTSNYAIIIDEFSKRGITDVQPRVNVLTAAAWRYKGRVVLPGETGVRIKTRIVVKGKETGEDGEEHETKKARRGAAYVFHISQTRALAEGEEVAEEGAAEVEKVTLQTTEKGGGLRLFFPLAQKPNDGVRQMLRDGGWHWHKRDHYWYNKLTRQSKELAETLVSYFDGVIES